MALRRGLPGVLAILLCAAALGVSVWSSVYGCASMSTPVSAPGAPQNPSDCVVAFPPLLVLLIVPPLVVAAGVLLGRPWLAWGGAVVEALGVPVFVLSTQSIRAAAALALVGALGWWQWSVVRPAGPRPPTPGRMALVATITAGILGLIAALWLASSLPQFWDPCHAFGDSGGAMHSAQAGGPCSSSSSSSLTRGGEAAILLLIGGVPLVLCCAVVWAAFRHHGTVLVALGIALAVHALPVFFLALPLFVLTWPVAACWIAAGLEGRRVRREAIPASGP
ncbi:MAG: hypothetical protein ACYDBQ_10540 [Thermoplasmatota archaeon]